MEHNQAQKSGHRRQAGRIFTRLIKEVTVAARMGAAIRT